MQIKHLSLRAFRNYANSQLELSPGTTVLHGDNAQGKTSLLEALYLLITGRSFRTQRLGELILVGEERFEVEARIAEQGIAHRLSISFDGQAKRIVHNGAPVASFATLLGLVRGVLFAPQDHLLVSGPPSVRRRFLDLHLVQIDPLYVYHLGRYYRALKQRNALLRRGERATLEAWEQQMAPAALYLQQRRRAMISELGAVASEIQRSISGGHDQIGLQLRAIPQADSEEALLAAWHESRTRDLMLRHTFVGPHRDDLLVSLDGQEARSRASEGQLRTLALALRFAEWERLNGLSEEPPLKLVDDFGVQLDTSRCAALSDLLQGPGQTVITSPTPLNWPSQALSVKVSQASLLVAH